MITVCFEKRGKSGLCEFLYDSIKSQILDGTLKANKIDYVDRIRIS